MEFTEQQIERYSRHMILPDVGGKGQKKLAAARVLVIGAGGLGSPAALYLAAAGVGTIGLVDGEVVALPNPQRKTPHTTATVGKPKVDSGRKMLAAINPDIAIKTYQTNITAENALSILSDYDLVLDGSDTFTTRYLVNDACFFAKKPLISGSIFRFEGQLTTLKPHEGFPCYRCLYLPRTTHYFLLRPPLLSSGVAFLFRLPRRTSQVRLRHPHLREAPAAFGLNRLATKFMNNPC